MTHPRLVRGTKSRMLAYLCALLLFAAVLFLYHNARVDADAEKEALGKCQQTQESLSAQLQVIFEYKVRLEKNLNEEKNRHEETKDKLQAYMSFEQDRKKGDQEAVNKFTALQQQYRLLQTQFEDFRGDCDKARASCKTQIKSVEQKAVSDLEKLKSRHMQVQEEVDEYRRQLQDVQNESKKSDSILDRYKKENSLLKKENENLKEQLGRLEKRYKGMGSSTNRGGVGPDGGPGVAGAPAGALAAPVPGRPPSPSSSTATPDGRQGMNAVIADQLAASNSKALGKQSTTPQINPEALLSQEKGGHGGAHGGAHGAAVAPPVAPAPPSLASSQGPRPGQQAQVLPKPKETIYEVHETQQQQVGVLPIPIAFHENQGQQPPAPAMMPPQAAPPQQNLGLHENPSNQGQQPPLDDGPFGGGDMFRPIPVQRNFPVQKGNDEWIASLHQSMDNQRREPVIAPIEARAREERQRADWDRPGPFQGVDYDKEVHAGENEEDDDDDADQMDNADNAIVRPPDKKFGANKSLVRNIMVNPR